MSRGIAHAMNLALLLTVLLVVSVAAGESDASSSSPQPCCFPNQFTSKSLNVQYRRWATVTYDYTNQRKMVQFVDSDEFYHFDLSAHVTSYGHTNGQCKNYTTIGYTLTDRCIPDDAQFDQDAGSLIGPSLGVNSFRLNSESQTGIVTVSQDNCYPIAYSLTDPTAGENLYVLITEIKEEIDPSVFDVDLSKCVCS
ncbi:uncharacterized protein LOC101851207 [Aplysia californica]|uniref:Uncharacterized protein LOC101851207 n=1 Tax=Aplysia californica TaxID=6500 RepID=A0ABM0JWQ1_APLCA|nr:uncharacterized protein LOC101851207 [Aplysia californica]